MRLMLKSMKIQRARKCWKKIWPRHDVIRNFMKHLALLVSLLLLLAGCGTTKTYTPSMAAGPAKPADYPIPVYPVAVPVPRPCQLLGQLAIGDRELTMSGGSLKGVMKTLMDMAREKGADAVQLVSVENPDFSSAHYRLKANLLCYTAAWETVTLTENDFSAYLQQHQRTLDLIEGIWSDGSPELIGIIKDASKPGRDFIAFTLNPALPSWRKGYKKMDIARLNRPGTYSLKFYHSDFTSVNTGLLLDQNRALTFYLPAEGGEYKISYGKIAATVPAN
jgi:hypothetical protein